MTTSNSMAGRKALCLSLLAATLLPAASAHASWSPREGSPREGIHHEGPCNKEKKEKLLWQETFHSIANPQPDPAIWTYDTGGDGWGNGELEFYCAYGSGKPPCDSAQPNAFVADVLLHLVARKMPDGRYTSARLLSKHLKSFQYGRIEARIRIPAGQGIWPAFWLLGEDIDTVNWPASGELDVMENIGKEPDTIHGSIHGKSFTGTLLGTPAKLPDGAPFAAGFHTYGMIWKPGSIAYYIDDPAKPYVTYTPKDLPPGAVWPFDNRRFFLIVNLAVGGDWPGNPDPTTAFPSEMLVDYLKVWELP
ncbi:glycoside hydrolase family 16 protein [Tunturiibacter empetritectus]|uniref:GH16 domain-containing protein n=1 Tax=Tunturiibacter lichenicola TaxID=2051959 RepID=A0A852VAL5_9BACT|nr:glycoside hydrolase family 16 protein [Edaphobacter lichenicola]NYF88730.1 hypothetical protein [Edaphobacter lichenicola]